MRILLVSDLESIGVLTEVAQQKAVPTETHQLAADDQPFALETMSAIIAIVSNAAKISEMLSETYARVKGHKKVTVRTPKGTVTIELDGHSSPEVILQEIQEAGIL